VPRSMEDLQVIYWKHDVLSVTWRQCDAHARHLGTTVSVLRESFLISDRSPCHRLLVLPCLHLFSNNTYKRLRYTLAIAIHAKKDISK
jgi:hypothetical protein